MQKRPLAENMVTQDCVKKHCKDLLCVACGWEGHCEAYDAPWPVFQTHACTQFAQPSTITL